MQTATRAFIWTELLEGDIVEAERGEDVGPSCRHEGIGAAESLLSVLAAKPDMHSS